MRKHPSIAVALPRDRAQSASPSISGWLALVLRATRRRREMRRGLRRLLDQPHLARDVGLREDQIRGALIRLRQESWRW